MYVIATAGHVDHGKSTLVRALTGMEPDRWAEEQRRGMTIDLGYAWTHLPSGEELAFVDVPGHERFISNMLAGIGPVPAVLLVIAADEGWAAQTEEHVRALDALSVHHGVVAVTRSDLADPGMAIAAARRHLAATSLRAARVLAVSGATGVGLCELRDALAEMVAQLPRPDPDCRVRLWVDRCFTIRGSGTVVTGTLPEGTLHDHDTLELSGAAVSIRGLQSLGAPVAHIAGTARVAVNLRGIARAQVHRGDALLTPHAWRPSVSVDVRVLWHEAVPSQIMVHIGSAAVPAGVRALPGGRDAAGFIARLRLANPLPLQVGDRLLLRDPGRRAIAAALVLDPAPPQFSRPGDSRRRAASLLTEKGQPDALREIERRGAVNIRLLQAIGTPLGGSVGDQVVRQGEWLVHRDVWRSWISALSALVHSSRARELNAGGVTQAEAVHALGLPARELLPALVAACDELEQVNGRIRRRGAAVSLRVDVAQAVGVLVDRLREKPFAAPESAELVALGLRRPEIGAAVAAGELLRLPGDVLLLPDAPARAAERLRTLSQPFTVSDAREALNTTRRVAVPLLEHLDKLRITQRVDDATRRLATT